MTPERRAYILGLNSISIRCPVAIALPIQQDETTKKRNLLEG